MDLSHKVCFKLNILLKLNRFCQKCNMKKKLNALNGTKKTILLFGTGKSLLEALILASTNPEYDKRLFIDLPVLFMKTKSSEHVLSL